MDKTSAVERVPIIDRQPILLVPVVSRVPIYPMNPFTRRGVDNDPEYLSAETLIDKYHNLIANLYRYYSGWQWAFKTPEELDDLYWQIIFEFIQLRAEYDPSRGVEFAGYIGTHLKYRVKHYVDSILELKNHEYTGSTESDEPEVEIDPAKAVHNLTMHAYINKQFELVEAYGSVPWEKLSKYQTWMIQSILIGHMSIEELAEDTKQTVTEVETQFQELCNLLYKSATSD